MISQDQKAAQQKILTMQRDLMNEILDYQIAYGAGSVGWNVTVQFTGERK